jgi:hypothetical protein
MVVTSLAGEGVRHRYNATIAQRREQIIEKRLSNVFDYLDTQNKIHRHDVGSDGEIVPGDREHGPLHIPAEAFDTVRIDTASVKKGHGVTFAATDIQDRPNCESLDQKFP